MYASLFSQMTQDLNPPPPFQSMNINLPIQKGSNQINMFLVNLYYSLFNDKNNSINLKQLLPFKEMKQEGSVCNKLIKRSQTSFRCYDCLVHEGSLICEECFSQGKHQNHRYAKVKQEGTCDCGNESILKNSGFCQKHLKNAQKPEDIPNNQKIMLFNMTIKRIITWILIVYSQHDKEQGVVFLYHFLKYLAELNKESIHYNRLTTRVLSGNQNPIIRQLFEVVLSGSKYQSATCKALMELLINMLPLNEFKVALFPLLIQLYNTHQDFQSSRFEKILVVLLCDAKTVQQAMNQFPKLALNPSGRSYNTRKYYEHLYMLSNLKPQAAELFLTPLLTAQTVPCQLMDKLQKCEQENLQPLSVITENLQNEYLYYCVMFAIVGVVQDRQLLAQMMLNYYKMMRRYDFYKNKIVLIPQRIFALCVFKYFHFNIEQADPEALRIILGVSQDEFMKFLWRYFKQMLNCLLEFSLNFVRTTFFYNYINIYCKEESQIAMVDYLTIKIIAQLFSNLGEESSLVSSIKSYYKSGLISIQNEAYESRKDYFDKWNKLMQLFAEIVYSPKVEVSNCIFLKAVDRGKQKGTQMLAKVVKSLGKVNSQDLDRINKIFYHKKCPEQWTNQVLILNKQQKKYQLRNPQKYTQIEPLHFHLLVSLAFTSFSQAVQNEKPISSIQLSESQQSIADILLNGTFLSSLFRHQLKLTTKLELNNLFKTVPELIRVSRLVNHFQLAPTDFEPIYQQIKAIALNFVRIYSESTNAELVNQSKSFLELVEKSLAAQNCQEGKEKVSQQLEKRKQLAKLKKERLLRERKMKENQQKFIQNMEKPIQPAEQSKQEEECLICKQKSAEAQLCFLSKLKQNNLLYDPNYPESKHIIFTSCFHKVHFSCFKNQIKYKQSINCPLCKSACNIVLAEEGHLSEQLELINGHVIAVINLMLNKVNGYATREVGYGLSYMFLLNLEEGKPMNQKDILLARKIYSLLLYSMREYKYNKQHQSKRYQHQGLLFLQRIQAFILACLDKSIQTQKPSAQFAFNQSLQLTNMMRSEQYRNLVSTFISIAQPQHHFSQEEEYQPIEQQNKVQILPQVKQLPTTLAQLFKLRDKNRCPISFTHTSALCIMCQAIVCKDCQQHKIHTREHHINEALFLNLQTGGLVYNHRQAQLNIRSLFVNKLGTVWHPELQSIDYQLDVELYHQVEQALKRGNLYYFLIHTFEGLKGNGIHDII